MYKGEVTVSQQQVPSFLKAALLLKISGNKYSSLPYYTLLFQISKQCIILGLSIHQSNLEVDTDHSDDIGFIQARSEEQGSMIQPEHDRPEDIISTQTSSIAAEPPLQMREEDKEETMVLVEEVTRECNVFRDGSLCDYQVSIYVVLLNAY